MVSRNGPLRHPAAGVIVPAAGPLPRRRPDGPRPGEIHDPTGIQMAKIRLCVCGCRSEEKASRAGVDEEVGDEEAAGDDRVPGFRSQTKEEFDLNSKL